MREMFSSGAFCPLAGLQAASGFAACGELVKSWRNRSVGGEMEMVNSV